MNKNHKPGDVKGMKIVLIPPGQFENMLKQANGKIPGEDLIDTRELVSSLAIEIWRLEKRINKIKEAIQKGDETPGPLLDQMQRIRDIFKKQDIEVCEHTGEEYNDGLSLKVLHVESVDDISEGKMKIIETVKPSVYLKGQVISYGEVIVGK